VSLWSPAELLALRPLCVCGGATHPIDSIVVHHTGDARCTLEGMHRDHAGRGWGGIGYHYCITGGGMVQRGRPIWARGCHCSENNAGRIGVAFIADCSEKPPSQAQVGSFLYLLESIFRLYGTLEIWPHYAVPRSSTLCPGRLCVEALSAAGVPWHTK